ncbi:MAG: porin [Burkholderiales bacterium]
MNKKLMAVAVAGALAAPAIALADTANVQIYGRANLGVDQYSATGATAANGAGDWKSRTRVFDNSSRLGVTGSEDLGGGLKAVFLMESGVNIDTGGTNGQSGAANPSSGTLSSRIGHVGLASSSAGQITFGRSNVWWANYGLEQTAANYVNTGIPFFSGSFGRGMSVGVARQSNLVQYTSPTMSGVTAIVSYGTNSEAAAAAANTGANLVGLTVQGQHGPAGWGFDYTKNTGAAGATTSAASNTGLKLRGGWMYAPGGQISLIYVKTTVDSPSGINLQGAPSGATATAGSYNTVVEGTATSLSQTAIGVNWEHVVGNVQLLAQVGKVAKISGCQVSANCDDTTATAYMFGARLLMSKRTAAYATYNAITNGTNYNMDYTGGSYTSASGNGVAGLPSGSVGADPKIIAVGIIHNF